MLLPRARQDKLTVRQLPDETLIYDHTAAKAHCLNQTAALVWHSCDGRTTVAELAVMLHRELGIPSSEALAHLALEQLQRRGLLEPLPAETAEVRQGRRRMLRKLGVGLAALPFIMTMTAPRANAAASVATCPAGQTMCSNGCKNLQNDPGNCGTCAKVCSGSPCTSGTCCTPFRTVCTSQNCCAGSTCCTTSGGIMCGHSLGGSCTMNSDCCGSTCINGFCAGG
jgi:hypothetical protein